MSELSRKFRPISDFKVADGSYRLLPFRFLQFDGETYFLSNEVGEFLFLSRDELFALVKKQILPDSEVYQDLTAKHFIYDDRSTVALDLLAVKARSKHLNHAEFTRLHLFVVTLRCDYSCQYCQVSRQTDDQAAYDMSEETALAALDAVFMSPSRAIKIEFQGGEPLLNFPLIKRIVLEAEKRNALELRDLKFVITTNMSYMDDDVLSFCSMHGIHLSTSLDGPMWLHNKNRPRPGKNGYQLTINGIRRAQLALGYDKVSAVMTTTKETLDAAKETIDTYVEAGMHGIFLRPLSPYGFAIKTGQVNRYDTTRWLEFFKQGLEYILEINKSGYPLTEFYTSMVVSKLFSPMGGNYVDLQSPAGAGLAAVVYNYDGKVYCSDEGRMLAEMGDDSFCMGNLHSDQYAEIFLRDSYLDIVESSVSESLPQCSECAFLPYCGSDPVYHYATQSDFIGHKAFSGFCEKNMAVFRHILNLIRTDDENRKIIMSWFRL